MENLRLALSFLIGAGLGAFFYGGLWWTVRKGMSAGQSGLLFLGSFLVRTAVVIAMFCLWSRGQLGPLVMALLGFAVVKIPLLRILKALPDMRLKAEGQR